MDAKNKRTSRKGFGAMAATKQREIASLGGRAAHEHGTAHEWTPDEAREAGRKGGKAGMRRGPYRGASKPPRSKHGKGREAAS
jgi:hypothetical protein